MAGTPPSGPPTGLAAPPGSAARAMGCNARTSHAKSHPRMARRVTQQVDLGLTKAAEPPPLIHGPPPEHLESNPSPMNHPRPKHLEKQFKYKIEHAFLMSYEEYALPGWRTRGGMIKPSKISKKSMEAWPRGGGGGVRLERDREGFKILG
ncbi:hypothetical protein F511_34039 [Dorcoceras hygrometricum]|uniref:Uncharacterized protein n=1 Tax=Dorcoceras hygrometricum TaxID=472368 RepID=A0A2Z7BTA1_9LAMI|nr:hypothetical protein F511_34039 [Dorcoceras hygrometricum]